MSMISEVLKNKNRVEKLQQSRRRDEINSLTADSAYMARLHEDFKCINMLLDSNEIESVVINIEDSLLPKFGSALFSSELADYDIEQVDGCPNKFIVRRRMIIF